MRLTCPNCDARYEVPEDAIPEAGREVQCSNCGHSWFQPRGEAPAAAPGGDRPGAGMPPPAGAGPHDAGVAPEVPDEPPAAIPGDPAPGPGEDAPAATLDESVRAILREEAEHEARLRRAEAAHPAGAGSPPAPRRDGAAAGPAAAARAELPPPPRKEGPALPPGVAAAAPSMAAPSVAAPSVAASAPRRDLLPDVEEITSTLRPATAGAEADAASPAAPVATARGRFRGGFLLALALLFLGAALYVTADDLALRVPALADALAAYVAAVDSLRLWANAMAERATAALQGLGGE